MRKATITLIALLALSALAFSSFIVSPDQDNFDILQNSSMVRTYMVESNDTSGIIDVSTSIAWVYDTTDYLNVTPGKTYAVKVTFSPGMLPPGSYSVVLTFAAKGGDIKTAKANTRVVKTSWIYNYLLPGEFYTDITYQNYTIGNSTYSLVLIKGADALLIKNDKEIVKNTDEIRTFYNQYYRNTIYPQDSELSQLASYLKSFNESRNRPVQYSSGMGAEPACRQFLGITFLKQSTGQEVHDLTTATMACQIVHADDLAACGEPTIVYGTLEFGVNVYNLDKNLSEYEKAMSSLTVENAPDQLASSKVFLEKARLSAFEANNSKLRYDTSCRTCVGMCPMIPYNLTALDQAVSFIGRLSTKAEPLRGLSSKPSDLLSKTNKRLSDVLGKAHKEAYSIRYETIRPIAEELSQKVAVASTNVYSPELQAKFAELNNVTATLESIIESGDYSDVAKLDQLFDSNMDKFYSARADLDVVLGETTGMYEKVYSIRQNASDHLVIAQMNVLSEDQAFSGLQGLRDRMTLADSKFTKPLRADLAEELIADYSGIAEEAKAIAKTKPSSSIVGRMVSKIVRTEKWIAISLVGLFKPLTLSEKTLISEYVGPATAGLVAFALAGVLLFLLIAYALRNRRRLGRVRHQLMLYSFFSAATLAVALICVGVFYYLTLVYSGETTLNMFKFEIPKAGGVAIFVDEATAYSSQNPEQTKLLMSECGESMALALSEYNPRAYYIQGDSCRIGGQLLNYSDCDREFSSLPIIYVRYGPSNIVSFRNLYAVNATLEGGDDWFRACHLAGALRRD